MQERLKSVTYNCYRYSNYRLIIFIIGFMYEWNWLLDIMLQLLSDVNKKIAQMRSASTV